MASLKHFEGCIGNQWMAWEADTTCSIKRAGRIVTITKTLESKETLTTIVDLDLIPAYAYY